jgi:uncharacterized protein CbrC (UPF0167 family)
MGKVFVYIADHALEAIEGNNHSCHVCNRTDVDIYPYFAELHREDGSVDDDISEVCETCIKTQNLSKGEAYLDIIDAYLLTLPALERDTRRQQLMEAYRRTPNLPMFMQYEDRPLCCADLTEFIGYPKNNTELYAAMEKSIYWEKKVTQKPADYDFRKYGNPESLEDVARFRCLHCGLEYVTFQFT